MYTEAKQNMKLNKKFFTSLFVITLTAGIYAQNRSIKIWKNIPEMKNEKSVLFVHEPNSSVSKTDIAVIICPGGSYHHLGLYNEGFKSAEWFNSQGITAFVLKYRTAEAGYHHPAMLQDIQRSIQIVREQSEEFGINPSKIGVIGYSAGGHLVALAGESGTSINELEKIGIQTNVSLRPDFCMPIYPVVTMKDPLAHQWSRKSFLGKDQSQERINRYSLELNVPADMPPTYVVCCKDDNVVDYNNSLIFYEALSEKKIKDCELHVYEWGKHGFGMLNGKFMKTFHWNENLLEWILKVTE